MKVHALYIHPLKSGAGIPVASFECTPFGPRDDRRWMVVDDRGQFLTQRSNPIMAQIRMRLESAGAVATLNGRDVLLERRAGEGDRDVTVWRSKLKACDVGDEAARAFSSFLNRAVRVVYMSDENVRWANPDNAGEGQRVSFADGYPYLITNTASLDDLNARANTSLEMERFRPNVVVTGATPWAEDSWERVESADVVLRLVKPCARCSMTTLDPENGTRTGPEPLRTLAEFRNWDGEVMFGWNAIGPAGGVIEVGQELASIARK